MTPPAAQQGLAWRTHACVLALGTFAVGTDAFVIAGLLPDISASLDISVGAAGQLVSVFSLAYALLSPVLAAFTARWSRRTVLITGLGVFAVGNVVTALAPDYALVLAARVIAAAGAAMFTPNAGATAATLAGPEHRGRAIAIVTVGLTASLALGAPLGTVIGEALGWQATMWFVTALALVVAPVIALRLPDVTLGGPTRLRRRLAPLADRKVAGVLAGTLVAFIGIYLPYTYISAVFEPATGGDGDKVAVLLLVFGLAGTAGNLTAGSRRPQGATHGRHRRDAAAHRGVRGHGRPLLLPGGRRADGGVRRRLLVGDRAAAAARHGAGQPRQRTLAVSSTPP
ncbi:MFS transporter [Streptomyces nogalater]